MIDIFPKHLRVESIIYQKRNGSFKICEGKPSILLFSCSTDLRWTGETKGNILVNVICTVKDACTCSINNTNLVWTVSLFRCQYVYPLQCKYNITRIFAIHISINNFTSTKIYFLFWGSIYDQSCVLKWFPFVY